MLMKREEGMSMPLPCLTFHFTGEAFGLPMMASGERSGACMLMCRPSFVTLLQAEGVLDTWQIIRGPDNEKIWATLSWPTMWLLCSAGKMLYR